MNRKLFHPVSVSESFSGMKRGNPGKELTLVDDEPDNNPRKTGILWCGNGYGTESAWIICNIDDLIEIE